VQANPDALLMMWRIVKNFPGVRAVDDVTFEVRPNEVHALVGENGAGKSTLIKILTGVYSKDEGGIHLHGKPVEIHSVASARHHGIAYIPQEITLVPRLDVARNIMLGQEPTRFGWVRQADLLQGAQAVLQRLGIEHLDLRQPIRKLGVGERQMVMIAKALLGKPSILVLDEPTAPLTRAEIDHLFVIIRRLKEQDVGIIYISHRMEEIFEIADRVSVMRNGKLVATLNIAQTTPDQIVTHMIGRRLDEMYPKEAVAVGEPVLEVRDVRGNKQVSDVSFTVHRGEILGIFGLVGAGKSELTQTLAGGLPMMGGSVRINGQELNVKSPHDAIEKGIVLIPKDRRDEGLLLDMDISENVTLPSLNRWSRLGLVQGRTQRRVAQEQVNALSIRARSVRQQVRDLSGGNQQKVVLGKWLATHDASIFIFDEPTRGVDVGAKTEIYRIIGQLVKRGAGVILVSSELPEVLSVSDHVLVMSSGRVVAEHAARAATADMLLGEAMGGSIHD
jgi:ABC-type sugar transport system ATPase subunit